MNPSHLVSASELISQFTMKSPKNRTIILTDRSYSVTKPINSPRSNNPKTIKMSNYFDSSIKSASLTLLH